jgi:threonine dehydrogenase-like Zn-dependent dehydrogenase
MKALVWHGRRDVRVDRVADPRIQEPTDAIIRVTTSGLCGSDLHLYDVLAPFMTPGDVLGHEPMGVVEEVGSSVTGLVAGDRVVVPFNIACGHCLMCGAGLQSQCETTQVTEHGMGAALFGYTKLYGQVPGGQAEFLRVPHADYGPIKVPEGPPDDRFVYLSDVLPTAWQAVAYATPLQGPRHTAVVLGLGPIGDMCTRVAMHLGYDQVIGVDLVPERLDRARRRGVVTIDLREVDGDDLTSQVRELTKGRGGDGVIDAVGMEAHGSPGAHMAHRMTALLPNTVAEKLMHKVGVDRLAALHTAIELVRRGGTVSLSGVYGGMADPMPMMTMFDKQVAIRMGQANVRRWVDDLLPLVTDTDVLGLGDFATHRLPLDDGPHAYASFQKKDEGMVKVLFDLTGSHRGADRVTSSTAGATTAMTGADVANGEAGVLEGELGG